MYSRKEHLQQRLIVLQLLKKIANEEKYSDYKAEEIDCGVTNNVTSVLFSVTLTEQRKQDLKLIAKTLILSGSKWLFTTELYFYSTVIEKFRRAEELHQLPEEHRLIVPKFYASFDLYPNQTLVLEDLTARGFESFDLKKPIDLPLAFKGMELIAKFHALSFACYKDDSEGFQKILEQKLRRTIESEKKLQMMTPKALRNVYEVSTNENRKALEKYFNDDHNNMHDRFSHFIKNFFKSNKNMRILVHGDFKPTNLMFRKRNNKLELAIIDFQCMSTRNPVLDLVFFFFVGADEQFRRLFYHQFLDVYYEQLKLALGRLHVDPEVAYSEEAFRRDVEELSMAGLVLAVFWLPLMLGEAAQEAAIEGGSRGSDLVVAPSALFRERFNGIVNNYREWGLL